MVETLGGFNAVTDASPLGGRVWWLVRLRWLAILVLFGLVTVASQVLHVQLRVRELYLVGGLLALFNVGLYVACRILQITRDRTEGRARILANLQIAADLLVLAMLIHYSGGVENPFAFYFIFHIIVSGTVLSPKEAWMQAVIAIALFSGIVELERTGAIAHYHVPGLAPPSLYRNSLYATATVVAFASTMCLAVFTAISITKLVRQREKESAALIAQLRQAYRKVDELERSKSQHLRRASHELRAPLGAVQNLLAMLEGTMTGEGRSSERDLAARAARRADQALKLVDDLLILARSQDARFTARMKEIYLPQTINDVVGMLRPRADKEGVALALDMPQDLPPVFGDAESLEQLFTNLTANAVKYTPSGGRVSVAAAAQGDHIVVQVTDTGIGILSEDLPYIFDEFYRGKNARQFAEQGTGLGLSIVKSVADMHGAEVRVHTDMGRGTTFELRMLRADTKAAKAAADS